MQDSPNERERRNAKKREQYYADPHRLEKIRKTSERIKIRYRADPEFRRKCIERAKAWARAKKERLAMEVTAECPTSTPSTTS